MKHIVIFLNYCQSRLDNAVYRHFAADSLYRRNATLLFLPKALDERELQHEVAELRKKQKTIDDVTFHVCSNLARPDEGDSVVSTIKLIRRLYQADVDHHYPTFVYGQMPDLLQTDDGSRKNVWRNLVVINNAVSDHLECRLLTNVYLYSDNSQKSLAEFIYSISHSDISFDKLSARLPVKEGNLFDTEDKESINFPPIFGGFNTSSISYPEYELRAHLQQYYLYSALRYSLPEVNETNIEACNSESQRILGFVPVQTERLCLQEESFLNLNAEENVQWTRVDKFWTENVELQMQGLSDYPREDWLMKIHQRVDSLYQARFRDIGTEYFFSLESKKTHDYCNVLKTIIAQEFDRAIQGHSYTPEAQKTIVRGIVNVLQQKVIEIQNLRAETLASVTLIEQEASEIKDRWKGLNIFNRLMGKDKLILDSYRDILTRLMIKRTLVPGCDFAIKLLNELIPDVSALIERCDDYQRIFTEALHIVETMVKETNPTDKFGIFGSKELTLTHIAMEADTESLLSEYQLILQILFDKAHVTDGEDLVSRIRMSLGETVDAYIDRRIDDCSIPPVLGMPIVERINRYTTSLGGIAGFVESMIRKTPISISIKKNCQVPDHFFLISSGIKETIEGVENLQSEDISHLQLLHIRYGLTLQDLEGFAGQRMFVEPSIF